MVRVVAKTIVKEGRLQEIKKLYAELVEEVRKEEGCVFYGLFEDVNNPMTLAMLEEWGNEASLEKHKKTPHMQRLGPLLKDCKVSAELHVYKQVF
jgi:quinol monooxygenase YgiN